jgi:adenylate kinase
MNIILLGPPGSGKGTQGHLLSQQYEIPAISTGAILRAAVQDGTALGLLAKGYMSHGALVPDELVIDIVKERLSQADSSNGFILDGFPRTVAQAEALEHMLDEMGKAIDYVINIEVPPGELLKRLAGRRDAEGRVDDTDEAIKHRLKVYQTDTEPLIAFYRRKNLLYAVPGVGSIEEIFQRIVVAL